ncbi:MAG: hypothetical protein GX039_02505 [Clostridia bacterium]|nr:hypothetical protein [Clostridia bacterium]
MLHYDRREWLLYKAGLLPGEIQKAMEDHLLICDTCLDNYLATIGPEDEALASVYLSPDFTARVTRKVANLRNQRKGWLRRERNWAAKAFQFYTIAAAITLLLLAGGWFDFIAAGAIHSPVRLVTLMENIEQKIPFGWSERLVENASDRLEGFIKEKGDFK